MADKNVNFAVQIALGQNNIYGATYYGSVFITPNRERGKAQVHVRHNTENSSFTDSFTLDNLLSVDTDLDIKKKACLKIAEIEIANAHKSNRNGVYNMAMGHLARSVGYLIEGGYDIPSEEWIQKFERKAAIRRLISYLSFTKLLFGSEHDYESAQDHIRFVRPAADKVEGFNYATLEKKMEKIFSNKDAS